MNFDNQSWSCHSERSEESRQLARQILRCAQNDKTSFDCANSSSRLYDLLEFRYRITSKTANIVAYYQQQHYNRERYSVIIA